jgi:mRNA interferase MazF
LKIRQGDIFWVDLGEPGGSEPGFRHPYVVIQNNVFNASRLNTVVLCALTSNVGRAKAPGNVLLRKGEGDLPKDSVVNITQIITVDKSDLVEKIGALPLARINQILEGVQLLLGPREV